jgi:hypothetical protein
MSLNSVQDRPTNETSTFRLLGSPVKTPQGTYYDGGSVHELLLMEWNKIMIC